MKRKIKRLLAFTLSLVMVIGMLPMMVFAEGDGGVPGLCECGGECADCNEGLETCNCGECEDCYVEPEICNCGQCVDCYVEPEICVCGDCADCYVEPEICVCGDCAECYVEPEVTKYNVIFYVGDTPFAEQVVEEGNKATPPSNEPNAPSDELKFDGWFTEGGTRFNFDTGITSNINLRANFEPREVVPTEPEQTQARQAQSIIQSPSASSALLGPEIFSAELNDGFGDGFVVISGLEVEGVSVKDFVCPHCGEAHDGRYTNIRLVFHAPQDTADGMLYLIIATCQKCSRDSEWIANTNNAVLGADGTPRSTTNIGVGENEAFRAFKVEFQAGSNGTLSFPSSRYVKEGTDWDQAWVPDPIPDGGYIFLHWRDQDGNTYPEASFPNTINKDYIFTAIFDSEPTEPPVTHTVTFNYGVGGSFEGNPKTEFAEIPDGTAWSEAEIVVPIPVPDESHYFVGWEADIPNGNFEITQDHVFTAIFAPRIPITLTADSVTKQFDGIWLSAGYTMTAGKLEDGHSHKADTVGEILFPGRVNNEIVQDSVQVTDSAGTDVTAMYDIKFESGVLIVQRTSAMNGKIYIAAGSAAKVYNGQPLTVANDDFTTYPSALPDGIELRNVEVSVVGAPRVNVGVSATRVTDYRLVLVTEDEEVDVTEYYTVVRLPGAVTVLPKIVTVNAIATPNSIEFGDAGPVFTPDFVGFVDGDGESVNLGRDPRFSTSYLPGDAELGRPGIYAVSVNTFGMLARNYIFVPGSGAFEVEPRDLSVIEGLEVDNEEKIYSSTDPVFDLVGWPQDLNRNHFDISFSRVNGEDVDTYTINAIVTPKAEYANLYSGTLEAAPGELKIEPLPVTITPIASSKVYGEPEPVLAAALDFDTIDNPLEGFVRDGVIYDVAREQGENADSYRIFITDMSGSEELEDIQAPNTNYIVSVNESTFTITQADALSINMPSLGKIYGDSDPEDLSSYVDVIGLLSGDTLDVSVTRVEGENVGEYSYIFNYEPHPNYEAIQLGDIGEFTITPRPIVLVANSYTITAGDAIPPFTAYIQPGYSLVNGDTALVYSLYRNSNSIEPGNYTIWFNIDENDNPNYAVTGIPGTLVIEASPVITVTPPLPLITEDPPPTDPPDDPPPTDPPEEEADEPEEIEEPEEPETVEIPEPAVPLAPEPAEADEGDDEIIIDEPQVPLAPGPQGLSPYLWLLTLLLLLLLIPLWRRRRTVEYVNEMGDELYKEKVKYGSFLENPERQIPNAQTIKGWFKDNDYREMWNFDEDKIRKNIQLFAKFDK